MSFWSTVFKALLEPAATNSTTDGNCRLQIRLPHEMGTWRDYGSTCEATCAQQMQSLKNCYPEDISVRTVNSRGQVIDMIN